MPTEEELEELDFARTFRDFRAEFADLEQARDPADDDADAPGPAPPEPGPGSGAESWDAGPPRIREEDLQQLFEAHRQLASFLEEAAKCALQGAHHAAPGSPTGQARLVR